MDFKDFLTREWDAVLYGQTAKFRIIKYSILIPLFAAFYAWRGPSDTLALLGALFVLSLCVHFFFRYMSEGWTKSWWLYKHTPTSRE